VSLSEWGRFTFTRVGHCEVLKIKTLEKSSFSTLMSIHADETPVIVAVFLAWPLLFAGSAFSGVTLRGVSKIVILLVVKPFL